MSKTIISDEMLEKLLTVLSRYAVMEIGLILPFDNKTDEEKENILKVALRSCETTTQILLRFLSHENLDVEGLERVYSAIKAGNFAEADSGLSAL